jgi:glycosyltransferase involved in cell wall biosynthesis
VTRRPIILDITRLVRRAHHPTPTGIDRIEHAWSIHLSSASNRDVTFQAWVPGLGRRAFPLRQTQAYIEHLAARWKGRANAPDWLAVAQLIAGSQTCEAAPDAVYLSLSHQLLHDKNRMAICRQNAGKLVIFLHDLIPTDFPEYARPGGSNMHDLRVDNSLALADGLIVNSHATAAALQRFAFSKCRLPPMHIAPFGAPTSLSCDRGAREIEYPKTPYFLCIGTIEPRKNHLLLLHIWRRMVDTMSPASVPKLILVGRRGWENENIIDMLERCKSLVDHVEERGRENDQELSRLLLGARAVLLPTFAEGFGLPVIEALNASVPVIASDLPVFREFAADVPDYLDPLDGPSWMQHILDYAQPSSAMRDRQIKRLARWVAPDWGAHFDGTLEFMDRL